MEHCFLAYILHELHVPKASEDYEPYEAVKQYWCICSSKLDQVLFQFFFLRTCKAAHHHSRSPQFIVCPQSGMESSHEMFLLLQERKQPYFPGTLFMDEFVLSAFEPFSSTTPTDVCSLCIGLCQAGRHSCRLSGSGCASFKSLSGRNTMSSR